MLSFSIPATGSYSKLVNHYDILRAKDPSQSISDKYIPSGFAHFVFNFSGSVYIKEKEETLLPKFFIVVPYLKAAYINVVEPPYSFIVTCKASVLTRLFRINFSSRTSKHYILPDFHLIDPVWNKMSQFEDPHEKKLVFEEFLSDKMLVGSYEEDEIDKVYQKILENAGKININNILESCEMKPRTLRRHFINRVGLNAKGLARLVRVNYLWDQIIQHKAIDFQGLIFDGNYFDQSHFIKDFKLIVGESPSFFFKRNREQVEFISGKNQNNLRST